MSQKIDISKLSIVKVLPKHSSHKQEIASQTAGVLAGAALGATLAILFQDGTTPKKAKKIFNRLSIRSRAYHDQDHESMNKLNPKRKIVVKKVS